MIEPMPENVMANRPGNRMNDASWISDRMSFVLVGFFIVPSPFYLNSRKC